MNAAIQAIAACGDLVKAFNPEQGYSSPWSLCLHQILTRLRDSSLGVSKADVKWMQSSLPDDLKTPNKQQDVEELLFTLLTEDHPSFMGKTEKTTRCAGCRRNSTIEATFKIHDLPVNNDAWQSFSVEGALHRQCEAEYLEGANKYLCEECPIRQDAMQTFRFTSLPRFLFISLDRFDYDRERKTAYKVMTPVSIPEVMEFNEESFRLIAVIVHVGLTADSGHYKTYFNDADCSLPNPKWFLADDKDVKEVEPEILLQLLAGSVPLNQTPYVLLYKKMTNSI